MKFKNPLSLQDEGGARGATCFYRSCRLEGKRYLARQ
jgi:hypothetical protein